MQEVGQAEKEREASGHARDEELGLVREQVEVGNPSEAESAAHRCARRPHKGKGAANREPAGAAEVLRLAERPEPMGGSARRLGL